ncbi:alpha/beta fold hydrolase [Nakamurella sp. GG22]
MSTADRSTPRAEADHRSRPRSVRDAPGWNGVAERLIRKGYPVIAPANPLRGLSADSAYLHSFLSQVDGPVLLVGHSYGAAVITNAAVGASNVVGLVYVSGFAPDEGERLIDVEAGSKDSVLDTALVSTNYPTGSARKSLSSIRSTAQNSAQCSPPTSLPGRPG